MLEALELVEAGAGRGEEDDVARLGVGERRGDGGVDGAADDVGGGAEACAAKSAAASPIR